MSGCKRWDWLGRVRWVMCAATAIALAGLSGVVGTQAASAHPSRASITVDTANEAEQDGLCSLREAVVAANTDQRVDGCSAGGGVDVISVPAGTYTLSQGALVFEASTVLRGAGATVRRPSGQSAPYGNEAMVQIADTGQVVIKGVTFDGSAVKCGGLINYGELEMVGAAITQTDFQEPPTSCTAPGALLNVGKATLVHSSITNNYGYCHQRIHQHWDATITNRLISGNSTGTFLRFDNRPVSTNSGVLSIDGTTYRDNGPSSLLNSGKLALPEQLDSRLPRHGFCVVKRGRSGCRPVVNH